MSLRSLSAWIVGALAVSSLAGCAAEETDSGIVSVADVTASASASAVASASASTVAAEASAEEQALAFAACMRDNGVDFPDPTVDADGEPVFDEALAQARAGGFDASDPTFTAAVEACGDLLDGVTFGSGLLGDDFDTSELEDALYAYTDCLREEGLDVGDLSIDLGSGASLRAGGSTGTASGSDASDRFAAQLGYDPDDPDWIAADEVCQPVLQAALTGASGSTE